MGVYDARTIVDSMWDRRIHNAVAVCNGNAITTHADCVASTPIAHCNADVTLCYTCVIHACAIDINTNT